MKTNLKTSGYSFGCIVFVSAVLLTAFNTQAQTSFEVNLDPLQEVPPHNTPAYGSADLIFDPSAMTLSIVAGTGQYTDLLGGATSVSVSDAAAGANGPTIFTLTLDTPGNTSGTFEGSGTLTAAQVTDLDADNLYINIRDSVYPSGEIRGQILPVPEPTVMALAGLGAMALLTCRRKRHVKN